MVKPVGVVAAAGSRIVTFDSVCIKVSLFDSKNRLRPQFPHGVRREEEQALRHEVDPHDFFPKCSMANG